MDVHNVASGFGCTSGGNYDITHLGWYMNIYRTNYDINEDCRWSFQNNYDGIVQIYFSSFDVSRELRQVVVSEKRFHWGLLADGGVLRLRQDLCRLHPGRHAPAQSGPVRITSESRGCHH